MADLLRRCARGVLRVLLASCLLATTAVAQPRVALVVGVSAYQTVPRLPNPANDASDIGAALKRLGFDTEVVVDPDRATLEQVVRRFGARARGADAALFFYAGHAVEAGGRNWLLPKTARITSDRDLRFEALDADGVLEQVEGAARVTVVFLDACRDNPLRATLAASTRSTGNVGLAPVKAAVGTLIAYATAPGTVAEDGQGRNSPFTAALLKHIETPGLEVRQMLAEVRRDVRESTRGSQVPWEHSSLEGAFYFRPPAAASGPSSGPRGAATDPDALFWESIRRSTDPADFQAYLEKFPQGTFAVLARNRVAQLAKGTGAPETRAGTTKLSVSAVAAAIPYLDGNTAAALAKEYVSNSKVRALAVHPASRSSWRIAGFSDANEKEVGDRVLERCQVAYGSPCVLVAVNDRIEKPLPNGAWPLRDMPNANYSGPYDPSRIPGASVERRTSTLVRDYADASEPKAMAYLTSGATLFSSTGATSAYAAEAEALRLCNQRAAREGRQDSCFLYAVGNQVVLPRRLSNPVSPAPDPAAGSLESRVLEAARSRVMKKERLPEPVRKGIGNYVLLAPTKALALEPTGPTVYVRSRRKSAAEAEQFALEGCQIFTERPCAVLAIDDHLMDASDATLRDMPRVRYAGRYRPEQVPMISADSAPPSVAEYEARKAPKALVISAAPPGFFARSAATQQEAEAAAMSDCTSQPAPAGTRARCWLYAVNDNVVLTRSTQRKK